MVKRVLETVFRKLSVMLWGSSSRTNPQDLFNGGSGQSMARYLTHRGEFKGGIVRYSAFDPPKSLRKSVYWIAQIPEEEIWVIGDKHVAPARGPILGRADFNSLAVYQNNLSIDLTGKPHPRHADIIGWSEDRKKARHEAQKLADASTLVPRP